MSFVLARATRQTYQTAYEKGALVPIATQAFHIVDNQIKVGTRLVVVLVIIQSGCSSFWFAS